MTSLQIVRATVDDSSDIWKWRNDPETRIMSLNSHKIPWESHRDWFTKTITNPQVTLLIGILKPQNEKVGNCRFDFSSDGLSTDVSIALSPSMRGKKLSVPFLTSSINFIRKERRAPLTINATVKKTNNASIKCFERCGFLLVNSDAELNCYRLTQDF